MVVKVFSTVGRFISLIGSRPYAGWACVDVGTHTKLGGEKVNTNAGTHVLGTGLKTHG